MRLAAFLFLLLFLPITASADPAQESFQPDAAQIADGCTGDKAMETVRADPAVAKFCSGTVNGQSNGCDFRARAPSPLNRDEINDKELAWVVTASIIHSFDDKGRPRFMPEGAAFARISKACKIMSMTGPSALPLRP